MAYNFQDIDPENMDFQTQSEEARKKRLAAAAAVMGGGSFTDLLGQYATDRMSQANNKFDQLSQTVQNPDQAIQQRLGIQPQSQGTMGPVMPQEIAQQRASELPPQQTPQAQAISPEQFQQVQQQEQQPQLPQPGPGVQVAGPTQVPPATTQTEQPHWMEQLTKAGTDPQKLAQFMGSTDIPEARQAAGKMIAQQYNKEQKQKEAERFANQTVQSGDLLPLMKRIQQEKGEGSYLKAYLYQRLGLNELAKDEQQKLGAGTTYQVAYDPQGNKALMEVSANGLPIKGYNEQMQELTPEQFGKFAVGAAPKHAFQMPAVHGTPVTRTNENGQVETGLMIYDPMTRTNYVQVGNQRKDTTGWTTMAQTPQYVYAAQGAGQQGKQAAQTGVQQPQLPGMAGVPSTTVPPAAGTSVPPAAGTTVPPAAGAPSTTVPPATTGTKITVGQNGQVSAQPIVSGGGAVTQRPGESFASFEQRRKIAEEQAAANIQANKEVNVAERKPGAEAKGKIEAKDINNQRYANETYGLIKPISDAIKQSTGSGLGTKVDQLAGVFGVGTQGAAAKAQLDVLGYNLVSNVPRFEGAQSDRDVALYERAAGDIANTDKPINVRLAALNTIVQMLKKYDKKQENDWSFSSEAKPENKIKIIKREKVQ